MFESLPALRLTGARVLRDGAFEARSVAVAEGRITRGPLPEVDMSGHLILPGIIDLDCGPAGPSADPATALATAERRAAAQGVTTAFVSQGWSWAGGDADPRRAQRLAAAVVARRGRPGTDLRLALHCEVHATDTAPALLSAVATGGVGHVVFADRLEEALTLASTRPEAFAAEAHTAGRTPEAQMTLLRAARERMREVPRFLCTLAEAFDRRGIVYGSHGDPDGETRETYSMIGAKLCVSPATRAAAALARAVGDPVAVSARDVLEGRATRAGALTEDLVRDGLCDLLQSGAGGPSLARAAFRLDAAGILPLQAAWALISERPAEVLRLADRGRIAPGRRADLVAVEARSGAIAMTMSGGRITHLSGRVRARVLAAGLPHAIAAE